MAGKMMILVGVIGGLLVLGSTAIKAQPPDTLWTKTFGGNDFDTGYCVQQTTDGGYIIVGNGTSFSTYAVHDLYLIKTDASGTEQWNRIYGGNNDDYGWSVEQTSDGGYIITGLAGSYGAGCTDVWLIKTDASGIEQWSHTWGEFYFEGGYSVHQTTDGGYVVAGYAGDYASEDDAILLKYDASGNTVWSRFYGGNSGDIAYDVKQTTDGGYIIVGYTESYGAGCSDVWLIKTDAAGNMQWNQTYGYGGYDIGYSVQQTSDGGYIIAGSVDGYYPDIYLIKTDASGVEQWSQTYGGYGNDVGRGVVQTPDGGYVVAGETSYFTAGNQDVCLLKYDASGTLQWNQTYGGNLNDRGYSVQQTTDGGFIITGQTQSYGAGYYDVWLIRLASEVGVEPQNPKQAYEFQLIPAYPNPFNPATTLSFELRAASFVKMSVYDISGQIVDTIIDGWRQAGIHEVTFDAANLPSGIYIARLGAKPSFGEAGSFHAAQKMVLVK